MALLVFFLVACVFACNSRLLPSLESQEGAYEFQGWALEKQAQVLADMDAKGAHAAEAEIMKRLPDSMRLGLLSYLGTVNTGVGARSIQVCDTCLRAKEEAQEVVSRCLMRAPQNMHL